MQKLTHYKPSPAFFFTISVQKSTHYELKPPFPPFWSTNRPVTSLQPPFFHDFRAEIDPLRVRTPFSTLFGAEIDPLQIVGISVHPKAATPPPAFLCRNRPITRSITIFVQDLTHYSRFSAGFPVPSLNFSIFCTFSMIFDNFTPFDTVS